MNEPDADHPLKTPEHLLQGALEQLRNSLPCEIEFDEWLGGGTSPEPVAVITRSGPGFDDKVAVKLVSPSERGRWDEAIRDCPKEFSTQHLVSLQAMEPLQPSSSERWIATLKIAGGDLSLYRPCADHNTLKGRSFAAVCATIVKSIIGEWNPDPQRYSLESIPPWTFLNSIFDPGRVIPGKALWSWLESNNISFGDRLIGRPARQDMLPNPLMIAANLESRSFGNAKDLRVFYGRAHGDLHLRNILMQASPPKPKGYKLIDLGGYNPKSPLTRDPMHLLLSISLEWLKSGIRPGTPAARALLEVLIRPEGQSLEKEYQEVSRAIHEAGHSWAVARSMGDEWGRQSLLSLVGCGLLYASRRIPGIPDAAETRGWFFELAAVAGRAYLEDAGVWERYVNTYAIQEREADKSASRQTQDFNEGAEDSGLVRQPFAVESDELPGAKILRFPSTHIHRPDSGSRITDQSQPLHQGRWEDLADALRNVVFDSSTWLSLAANTDMLLRRIRETCAARQADMEEISPNLRLLERTLTDVLRPSTSAAELRAACSQAEMLRSWLLDLLDGPE